MPWHIHKEGLGFCESATPPLQLPVQTWHKHFTSRGRKLAPGQGGREPVSHQGNVFGFVAGKRSCLELGRIKLYKPQAWEISNQLTSCFLTFVSFLVATKQRAILPKHFPPHRKQWNQLCQLPVHLLTEQISKSLSSCGSLWGGGGVFGYLRDLLKAFENHALEGAGERPVSPSRIIFMNNQLLCSAREKCYFRHFWQQ